MPKDIVKIKRSTKHRQHIPSLSELKDGMFEYVVKNSINATIHYMRSAISSNQSYIDIPFVINSPSDYITLTEVLKKLRAAGYDIETISQKSDVAKLPEGKEFARTFIVNRYHVVDRQLSETSTAKSFKEFRKVVGDSAN